VRRLELTLSRASTDLAELLARLPGVTEVQVDGLEASFAFSGGPTEQHELLAQLLREGHPVCAFTELRRSLQDAYLAQMDRKP